MQLPFFPAAQVHAALGYELLAESPRLAFRAGCAAPLRHVHDVTGEGDRLLLPAWRAGVRAEMAELVAGAHPGRQIPEAMTPFKSVGTALEDLRAARLVLDSVQV